MSKKRKAGRSDDGSQLHPGFVRGKFAEVASLVEGNGIGKSPPYLPKELTLAVADMVNDTFRTMFPVMPELHTLSIEGMEHLAGLLHYSAAQGFAMALYRYANELKRVPELKQWHSRRDDGINKGHATQSQASEARHQLIRDKWASMEAAGEKVTNETVAAAIRADGVRCSRSTVIRAFKTKPANPTPKKTRRRSR